MNTVELRFAGDLGCFLARPWRAAGTVCRDLEEKTAVKDLIEACGVPHPEVDLIAEFDCEGVSVRALDFSTAVASSMRLAIHPVPAPAGLLPSAPRLQPRGANRFVADVHLGALARHLRLLGLDTAYERDATDDRLIEIMLSKGRALLTRDRRLLMRSVVSCGYCPRSDVPEVQVHEVLRRFAPLQLSPWSRCLRCNGIVEAVEKGEVEAELAQEPRTLRYYQEFFRCTSCRQVYWRGSHAEKLAARLARLNGEAVSP